MIHPDVSEAVVEVVEGILDTGRVYVRLQDDFAQHLPAVLVDAEQNDSDALAEHRVRFEAYADSLPAARDISRTITALLTGQQHLTAAGLLDPGRVEAAPRELPYADPAVARYSFTLVVETRAL